MLNPVYAADDSGVVVVNAPVFMANGRGFEVAGGKGLGADQSFASCIGEGIERHFLTGVWQAKSTRASFEQITTSALDPKALGYPLRVNPPGQVPYTPQLPIEWVNGDCLTTGTHVSLPANLVFAPYTPAVGSGRFSMSSTNGAACGATLEDATVQSLLELVERDAFWFYSRTISQPSNIPVASIPREVQLLMRSFNGKFRIQELRNPFNIPVVQVTYESNLREGSRTARGTGATMTLESSIRRAFSECIQMYESLSTGLEVSPSPMDMRSIWYTGEVKEIFPEFFSESGRVEDSCYPKFSSNEALLQHLLESISAQSMHPYRHVLVETSTISVVKCLLPEVSVVDSSYFKTSSRFESFAQWAGTDLVHRDYSGSLFM
ncbi:hypothetical protein GCM10023063_39620 [Arthrobacter methylotrophus]|uniref:YcaO-like family protein n=2 Tax=Arthrobacter methylotrophus TaxID=121291 RepID=A0ABV5UU77_9MICC